jgi:hypothetical protein
MSFIDLEFMGIQFPDIMADSANAKQMILTLNRELDWPNSLHSTAFSLNGLMKRVAERLHKTH